MGLTACGKDKEDASDSGSNSGNGSGSGTTDTNTDPGALVHESGFTLTVDDADAQLDVTSSATYAVDITEDDVTGFISYSETTDGSETCSAVLTIRAVFPEPDPHHDTASPSPADAPPCDDCDYGHFVQTDISTMTGSCLFGAARTALDQVNYMDRTFSTLVFGVYDGGSTLRAEIQSADDTTEVPLFDDGTATFDGSTLQGTNSESTIEAPYWDGVCADHGAFTVYNTMVPGDLALSDTLECTGSTAAGTWVYDTWMRDLTYGQSMTAAVRSAEQELFLYVVAPNECISTLPTLGESCDASGSGFCQSIELLAQVGGPYTVVVEAPCDPAGVVYEFDARVF